jgi:2-polyprenyl-3-methyl-5-hydroxy-6-metoxy-1,4-benzoquinol methylase
MNKDIKILSPAAKVSMADEWFDVATTTHFWMQWRFQVIKRSLGKQNLLTPGSRYLEIGCGHGQFLEQSDEQLGIVTDGCDLNLFALQKIGQVKGEVFVYDIALKEPSMLSKYQGVFLLDVIEHIDDDQSFLNLSADHLSKNGLVVINVPALQLLFSQYDVVAGHKRRYSKADLNALFEKCGIELLDIQYWGLLMLPIAFIRKFYLKFVNSFFKSLMNLELFLFKNPFVGTSLVAIGRKK